MNDREPSKTAHLKKIRNWPLYFWVGWGRGRQARKVLGRRLAEDGAVVLLASCCWLSERRPTGVALARSLSAQPMTSLPPSVGTAARTSMAV